MSLVAALYPEELPSSIRDNPRRRAEVRTYDALSLLGGAWWVFYSVPWLTASSPASGRRDGETDFVVAHPQHGFIALEVKGGGISREGGVWFSTDRDGVKHEIKDPFQQAMQGKKVLLGQVKDHRSWPGAFVRSAHAAVFPDLPIVPPLGPHAPPDIAITRSELENIERKLIKIATDSAGADAAPHADGDRLVHVLNELLGKSLFLRVPFATRVADTEQEIVRLTEEQFGVLHMLGFQRRAAIPGLAWGALTGACIAAYTLNDGWAVKVLAISPFLIDYTGNCFRVAVLSHQALAERAEVAREWRAYRMPVMTVATLGPLG